MELPTVKDDVVESLSLQLEQMLLTGNLYPEAKALMDSMSNVHELVVSLISRRLFKELMA